MKVVICGAGIAGLALANRLHGLGWEVVLLEKAPGPRPQGYMMDFFGPGYDAAEAMGLLPGLHELGYQVDELAYVDASGRRTASLRFSRFAEAMQGRLVSIMRPDLEQALREQLPEGIDLRYSTSFTRVENRTGGVHLTLTDGSVVEADLLVGADGIHSAVRNLVFGPERDYVRPLGFHTAAFTFDDPYIHAEVRGRFCLTDSIDRQMAFYALRDGRVASFAVQRTSGPLPEDPRTALRAEYGSLGWVVPRALEHCPPASEVYYDDVAQIEMPLWSHGRVVLLGDSCQAVSLLAGQGASLAIAGAYVLAAQVAGASTLEEGLQRYERSWRPVVEEKQQVARDSARWFLPHSRYQLWKRRIALKLAGLPGIDRYLVSPLGGKTTGIISELSGSEQGTPRSLVDRSGPGR